MRAPLGADKAAKSSSSGDASLITFLQTINSHLSSQGWCWTASVAVKPHSCVCGPFLSPPPAGRKSLWLPSLHHHHPLQRRLRFFLGAPPDHQGEDRPASMIQVCGGASALTIFAPFCFPPAAVIRVWRLPPHFLPLPLRLQPPSPAQDFLPAAQEVHPLPAARGLHIRVTSTKPHTTNLCKCVNVLQSDLLKSAVWTL